MSRPTDLPDQSGRTFVVTGANSGLGLETTRSLAAAGAHVVMAVRDTAKGETAAASLGTTSGSTEVAALDLADLSSVEAFADGWGERTIDALVDNAGIMMVPQGRTADGYELQLGTNHLGHFALTMRLLPLVRDRVVSVSSLFHQGPPMDLSDRDHLDLPRYSPTKAYQRSKLANLLFTAELARRLSAAGSSVRAMAAHPGYSATNLQSHHGNPLARVGMWVGNKVVAQSAAQGARPTLMALTDDLPTDTFVGPKGIGELRGAPGPVSRSAAAQDEQAAAQLWALSEELTGTSFPI